MLRGWVNLSLEEMNTTPMDKWPKVQIYDGGQICRAVNQMIGEMPVVANWLKNNNPAIVIYAGKGIKRVDKIKVRSTYSLATTPCI